MIKVNDATGGLWCCIGLAPAGWQVSGFSFQMLSLGERHEIHLKTWVRISSMNRNYCLWLKDTPHSKLENKKGWWQRSGGCSPDIKWVLKTIIPTIKFWKSLWKMAKASFLLWLQIRCVNPSSSSTWSPSPSYSLLISSSELEWRYGNRIHPWWGNL